MQQFGVIVTVGVHRGVWVIVCVWVPVGVMVFVGVILTTGDMVEVGLIEGVGDIVAVLDAVSVTVNVGVGWTPYDILNPMSLFW